MFYAEDNDLCFLPPLARNKYERTKLSDAVISPSSTYIWAQKWTYMVLFNLDTPPFLFSISFLAILRVKRTKYNLPGATKSAVVVFFWLFFCKLLSFFAILSIFIPFSDTPYLEVPEGCVLVCHSIARFLIFSDRLLNILLAMYLVSNKVASNPDKITVFLHLSYN